MEPPYQEMSLAFDSRQGFGTAPALCALEQRWLPNESARGLAQSKTAGGKTSLALRGRHKILVCRLYDRNRRTPPFRSDNYAGICPEAFAAMAAPTRAMRSVMVTTPGRRRRESLARGFLKRTAKFFFVFNAPQQLLSLASLCQSYP